MSFDNQLLKYACRPADEIKPHDYVTRFRALSPESRAELQRRGQAAADADHAKWLASGEPDELAGMITLRRAAAEAETDALRRRWIADELTDEQFEAETAAWRKRWGFCWPSLYAPNGSKREIVQNQPRNTEIEVKMAEIHRFPVLPPGTPMPRPADDEVEAEPLKVISAAAFAGKSAPAREWLVAGLIPSKIVGGLYGDGAVGKSLLALQLGVACVTGSTWLGRPVKHGPCVYLCCEDDEHEVWRRLEDICRETGVDMGALGELHIVALADEDSVLATTDGRSSVLTTTRRYVQVVELVERVRPALVVGDTLSDIFAANENDRMLAKQFVKAMRRLVVPYGGTGILLAHPSLDGMRTGRGSSGTTGWSNSMRWRAYVDKILAEDGTEPDSTKRVFRVLKANYGPQGGEIALRWHQGCYKLDGAMRGDPFVALAKAEWVFLELLRKHIAQNNHVGANERGNYAPRVFEPEARKQGVSRAELRDAMARLLEKGTIENAPFGQPSKKMFRLHIVNG